MQLEVFPPHGFVRLVKSTGDELDIVNAARVSFHNESTELTDRDEGLLRFLLTHKHGTPFEQGFNALWHVRIPIFVMREWVRHRIGHSVNEESGRYVELRPDFYIPKVEDVRTQVGKPGSYSFEQVDYETAKWFIELVSDHSKSAYDKYQTALQRGIAKEQARILLPLNLYTEVRWTSNARSLMHFLGLRNAPDAQFEIRKYAEALEAVFEAKMPTVHKIFVDNGRIAP